MKRSGVAFYVLQGLFLGLYVQGLVSWRGLVLFYLILLSLVLLSIRFNAKIDRIKYAFGSASDPETAQIKQAIWQDWKHNWQRFKKEIKEDLFLLWENLKYLPAKTRRRVWNKHILRWWYELWIREDEDAKSLNTDLEATMEMNPKEYDRYIEGLMYRRQIAHYRDWLRKNGNEYPVFHA